MVSLLNKSNAIYQLLGQPMFLLALLALCVLTVRDVYKRQVVASFNTM